MTINLTLPTSWNSCTPSQLEAICLAQQQAQLLPADQQSIAWKTNCFLALAGLEIEEANLADEQGNKYFLVRQKTQNSPSPKSSIINSQLSIPLYAYQAHYWIKEHLGWLDSIPNIARFPYPEWQAEENPKHTAKFRGPGIYLNGWTWQQYQQLKDYLTYFFLMQERKDEQRAQHAMHLILATLYNREITFPDAVTGQPAKGYRFHPDQATTNADCFRTFSPIRFAVILLWWSGVAHHLAQKYPKCFAPPSDDGKKKKKKRAKTPDPQEEYARTTATLEKYMGVNEQQLQQESYTVVLQHLQDMIKQNEDIERMNRKMKQKH